jgi:penicillin-insensitive murein endopeptidase
VHTNAFAAPAPRTTSGASAEAGAPADANKAARSDAAKADGKGAASSGKKPAKGDKTAAKGKSEKSDKTAAKGKSEKSDKTAAKGKSEKSDKTAAKGKSSSKSSKRSPVTDDARAVEAPRSSSKSARTTAPGDELPKGERRGREPAGRSIGAPNHGRLADGAKLDPSKVLRIAPGAQRWALPVLVHALERIAAMMARDHKSPPMFVGDLSAQRGGKLGPHRSHQSGRDVDIAYYATDLKGRPVKMNRFVPFDGKGRAKDGSAMRFDDARNWALVRALVEDRAIRVRYMFVTHELEDRIIGYATKRGAKRATVARAAEVMQHPDDIDLHDNHIHLRIDCPAHTRDACVPESVRGYDEDAPKADATSFAAAYREPAPPPPLAEPAGSAPPPEPLPKPVADSPATGAAAAPIETAP